MPIRSSEGLTVSGVQSQFVIDGKPTLASNLVPKPLRPPSTLGT